jgi:outer membrane protein assembly factor BamB
MVMGIALLASSLDTQSVHADLDPDGVERVAAATVLIVANVVEVNRGIPVGEHERVPLGSGILVSDDGLILTNSHVIDLGTLEERVADEQNATGIELEIAKALLIYVVDSTEDDPDARYTAEAVLDEPSFDLAVLQIVGDEDGRPLRRAVGTDRTPLPLAPSGEIGVRDLVHIFGYPAFGRASFADFAATTIDVLDSRVRSLERIPGLQIVAFIHIDATVSGGSSGGAVVDEEGRLVGVMAEALGGVAGGSAAVAIPVDRARAVLNAAGWVESSATTAQAPDASATGDAAKTSPLEPTGTTTVTRDSVASGVAVMFGGNAAHTGVQPGPFPQGTPRLKWQVGFEGEQVSSAVAIDGLVFMTSTRAGARQAGILHAIDAETGLERWRFAVDDSIEGTPAVDDGTVYVTTVQGTLHAIDSATGDQLWSYAAAEPGARLAGQPPALQEPTVANATIYVGQDGGTVFALDAASGEEQWRFSTEDPRMVMTSPAVGDGVVYVGDATTGNVYALNADSGDLIWLTPTGGSLLAPPSVYRNAVFVGGAEPVLRALDSSTGASLWNFPTQDGIGGMAAAADGIVYFGSDDGFIYAADAQTGRELWRFAAGSEAWGSPALWGGTVCVGTRDGDIFTLNAKTGQELWQFPVQGGVARGAAAVADGVVFMATNDMEGFGGNLFAIEGTG